MSASGTKRTVSERDDGDESDLSSKKQKVNNIVKNNLLERLRDSFVERDLQAQQKIYGPLLKTCLPLPNSGYVNLQQLPYFSPETLQKFYLALDQANEKPEDNGIVVMAQCGCSGRVELCIAAGIDPSSNYTLFANDVEYYWHSDGKTQWFYDAIKKFQKMICKGRGNDISDEEMKQIMDHCVPFLEIWVLAHIEWALEVAEEFKSDEMQFRKACIGASYVLNLRNTRCNVSCVDEILLRHQTKFTSMDSLDDYVDNYIVQLQEIIGDSRVPLILFDHITALEYNSYLADFKVPLKEAFAKLLIKLRVKVPKWKFCISDRQRKVLNYLPPECITPFTELPKITYEDIVRIIESYFTVDLDLVASNDSDLKKSLQCLCGRQMFISDLLLALFNAFHTKIYDTPENLLQAIEFHAKSTFQSTKKSYIDLLQRTIWHSNKIGKQLPAKTMDVLVAQVFIAAVIQNQDHIVIEDEEVVNELVESGLIMSSSTYGKQIIRRKDEPLFFMVVNEYVLKNASTYKDIINKEIIGHSIPLITNVIDMTGRVTEHLIAWHMIQAKHSGSLIFENISNSTYNGISNDAVGIERAQKSFGSSDLIDLITTHNFQTILLDHNRGSIDMCFLANVTHCTMPLWSTKTVRWFGVISCKPRAKFLEAVDPNYVLSTAEKKVLQIHQLDPSMPCQIEEEGKRSEEIVENFKIKQKYWYRIIYSSEPFPARLIQDVNLYNDKFGIVNHAPIVLISINDNWLNKEVQAYLRKHEPCVIDYSPRN